MPYLVGLHWWQTEPQGCLKIQNEFNGILPKVMENYLA